MWRLVVPKARHVVALIVFVSLLLPLLYMATRHTDPYEAAERFLSSDVRVVESVGSVTRIDFKFWDGFHFNGEEANFTFEVTGSKGASVIEVSLRRSSGVWRVVTTEVLSAEGAASRIVRIAVLPSTALR